MGLLGCVWNGALLHHLPHTCVALERSTGLPIKRCAAVHAEHTQGFPSSVAPQYAPYMAWRGVQYMFGGAISVCACLRTCACVLLLDVGPKCTVSLTMTRCLVV
jgi:hypothetical protein